MTKAIIFDFFGVLCSDEYWRFIKQDKEISEEFLPLSEKVNLGKIEWSDFIQEVSEKTGKSIDELMRGYASQKLNPQLMGLIEYLHKQYKTALLTNASRDQIYSLTKDVPLTKLFDEIVISSDVGFIKPNPKIYEFTLHKLGVEPHEAIFIDDSPKLIAGAKAVGIKTILYENFGQMKTELDKALAAVADN